MKRLFLLGIVLLTSFVLTGCNLIPQDIQEQLSEELCREDPTNELCDLENIQNLEDEVIMDLVEEAFMRAKEKANKTKCSEIFSPTNPDLLESCRMEETDLIPTDITEFTPFHIEVEGNIFMVTGTTNLDNTEITIKVSVVEIDGKSYIDGWSTVRNDLESGEVTEASAIDMLDKFFMEFDDESISNEVFCNNYFGGIDNDCNLLRTDFFEDNQEIISFAYKSHGGAIYVYHVTVLKLDGTSESVDVEVEVFRQEFGPVQVRKLMADGEDNDCDGVCLTEDKVKELFMEFASDYFNRSLSDQEVSDKWLTEETKDVVENRQNELDSFVSIEVISVFNVDSFFDIEYKIEFTGEEPHQGTLKLQLEETDRGYVFIYFDGVDDDCDGICTTTEDAISIFQMFADDYFDETITNAELDQMWLYGESPFVLEGRQEEIKDVLSFTVSNAFIVDSFFDIEYKIEFNDGTVEEGTVSVKIYMMDNMSYMIMFLDDDDDGDSIPIDDAEMILKQFFMDFLDDTISDEDFANKYFDGDISSDMYRKRKDKVYSDIVFINIYSSDNNSFKIDIDTTVDGVMISETLEVRVNRWESKLHIDFGGGYDCDIDDCPVGLDPIESREILKEYFETFFDPTITDEELFAMYFDSATPSDYLSFRSQYLTDYTMVEIVEVFGHGEEFTVILEWSNDDGSMRRGEPKKVKITKPVDKATPLLSITDPGGDFDNDGWPDVLLTDSFFDVFTDFAADYFDPTVTDDTLNSMYFNNMMNDEFFADRQAQLDVNGHVTVLKAHAGHDFGWYYVEIEIFDGTDTMHEKIMVKITSTDSGYYIDFSDEDQCDDCSLYPYDQAVMVLDNFKASFNHQSIISETMCAMYTEYPDLCTTMHSERISDGFMMTGYELYEEDYMYVVTFYFEDATGIKENEMYHIIFYDKDNSVMFEIMPYMTPEERMLMMYIYDVEMAFTDLTVTDDEACSLFTTESSDECMEVRDYVERTANRVEVHFNPMAEGMPHTVTLKFFNDSSEFIGEVTYNYGLTDDNVLFVDRGVRGVNPLFQDNN